MHQSVMTWLAEKGANFDVMKTWEVLEVGCLNENGSPREIFERYVARYVGVDMREGRDVDIVAMANDLPFPERTFDLVICTEMLEHDIRPWQTLPEIARVMRHGASLLLTARGFDDYGGYPNHPCPGDFWRFNQSSFNVLIRDAGLVPLEIKLDPQEGMQGVFAHATKP